MHVPGEGGPAAPTCAQTGSHAARCVALLSLSLLGCSSTAETPGPDIASVYVVPASLAELDGPTFFDHPWPSDLRLEEGSPRFEGFYNPRQVPLIEQYVASMKSVLDGFSPVAAGFVRFGGAIDPASLPSSPAAALSASSPVQLVDIDPASPEHGQRHLVSVHFRRDEGVYWRNDTLAFMPTPGFPLRHHTRYALVVTDALVADGGGHVLAGGDLRAALGLEASTRPEVNAASAALAPAVAELSALRVTKEHIVQLAVFTTDDPAEELFRFRDALKADVPPPVMRADKWELSRKTNEYTEYLGEYGPSPNYQAGTLPFATYGDGGQLNYVDGKPAVVDLFDLRFSLSVPNDGVCPMPEAGYPIVMFAHGSGGDYRDYVHSGVALDLAQRCIAAMGVDQIFHGTRPGAPADGDNGQQYLLFFNFQNIVAARANNRQSALDEVQRARLFTDSHVTVPAIVTSDGAEVKFDASNLMFFGHSQGGLNGPLYMAIDDSSRGGVMSGSSGVISITLLEKSKPSPGVATLVKSVFLALKPDEDAEVNIFHPAIALAQTIVDVVDPVNYARYPVLEPRAGFAPKSYLMTEGINADGTGDSYAPPNGIEALALAVGLPASLPEQRALPQSAWGGPQPVLIAEDGLSGNLADGQASGALQQWAVPEGDDGHFVVFDVPAAKAQATRFLSNLTRERPGRVPAP